MYKSQSICLQSEFSFFFYNNSKKSFFINMLEVQNYKEKTVIQIFYQIKNTCVYQINKKTKIPQKNYLI